MRKVGIVVALIVTVLLLLGACAPTPSPAPAPTPPPTESITPAVEEPVEPVTPPSPPLTEWQEAAIRHTNPEPKLSAEITIDWSQEEECIQTIYDEILEEVRSVFCDDIINWDRAELLSTEKEWKELIINCQIKNTGNVVIRYCWVSFIISCKDGTQFQAEVDDPRIKISQIDDCRITVDVKHREVESVEIEDYKLWK